MQTNKGAKAAEKEETKAPLEETAAVTEDLLAFLGEGVTQEQVDAWKQEFKKVFGAIIGVEPIVFRRLKRSEYKTIILNTKEIEDSEERYYQREENFVAASVLFPEDTEALMEDNCGLATILSDIILAKSGFNTQRLKEL